MPGEERSDADGGPGDAEGGTDGGPGSVEAEVDGGDGAPGGGDAASGDAEGADRGTDGADRERGTFELRDHTADVAVAARGPTMGAAMAAVADGMAAAMCDDVPAGGDRFPVSVAAERPEALLFDYLDELIYERDVRGVLPVDNAAGVSGPGVDDAGGTGANEAGRDGTGEDAATVDAVDADDQSPWRLSGSARGVPLSAVRARDLKAVTYSEMELRETPDGWRAYVVFDV